jgi:hypothetical protein
LGFCASLLIAVRMLGSLVLPAGIRMVVAEAV